jgi:hypothetical protein
MTEKYSSPNTQPQHGKPTEPMRELIIRSVSGENIATLTTVRVNDRGDLVFEGSDTGATVEQFCGGTDYDFTLTVPAAWKDTMLLHLIKDRFADTAPLREWCTERGIPCQFDSWVSW